MNELLSSLPEAWRNHAVSFMAGGLLVSVGLGWSGFYRDDPFTGKEGDLLDERITVIEQRIPKDFPPLDWQIADTAWRASIRAEIDSIRVEDRRLHDEVIEMQQSCKQHNTESEEWKRRIERNEQSIENLWKWYQQRTQR